MDTLGPVLIVSADATVRERLSSGFIRMGLSSEVVVAESADAAVDIVRINEEPFEAVLFYEPEGSFQVFIAVRFANENCIFLDAGTGNRTIPHRSSISRYSYICPPQRLQSYKDYMGRIVGWIEELQETQ